MPKIKYCIDCGRKCQGKRCWIHRNEYFKTEEHKKIQSKASKGRTPWNKNKKFIHSGSFKKGHKGYSGIGENNSNWKGGKRINSQGYVEIRDPVKKKYYLEHIKIVENFIKHPLKKSEVIHHINEIKTDNRIENLMIFPNPNKHKQFHNKVKQFGFTNPILRRIENRWK